MDRSICQAIEDHCLLKLEYGGESRIVQPHIYGRDHHGHELLSAYQVSGGSRSGEAVGWKLFDMTKIEGLEILSSHFRRRQAAYNPDDAIFMQVYSRL